MKDFIITLSVAVILSFAILSALVWLIDAEKPYFSWEKPGKQYISYRTYRRLSAIAPDRWWVSDDSGFYVCYSYKEGYIRLFMDSPISVFQLWLDNRKRKKEKVRSAEVKEMEELIKSWKMDLDEYNRREENESSGNHYI